MDPVLWTKAASFGKPMQDQFEKDGIPWEGPHTGAGAERDHEGAVEMKF